MRANLLAFLVFATFLFAASVALGYYVPNRIWCEMTDTVGRFVR